jgi:hypothetical protein
VLFAILRFRRRFVIARHARPNALAKTHGECGDTRNINTGNGADCLTPKNTNSKTSSETSSDMRSMRAVVANDLVEYAGQIFPGALETLGIASSVRGRNRNRLHALVARAEISF